MRKKRNSQQMIMLVGSMVAIIIGVILLFFAKSLSMRIMGILMIAAFMIMIAYTIKSKIETETDIIRQMKIADESNSFRREIEEIKKYEESLELHKEQFYNYKGNVESMREAYQIIYDQIHKDMKYILDYISHYDYISKSTKAPVNRRLDEMKLLIGKLNELDMLYIEIDNAGDNTGVQQIDDLLNVLKEMTGQKRDPNMMDDIYDLN